MLLITQLLLTRCSVCFGWLRTTQKAELWDCVYNCGLAAVSCGLIDACTSIGSNGGCIGGCSGGRNRFFANSAPEVIHGATMSENRRKRRKCTSVGQTIEWFPCVQRTCFVDSGKNEIGACSPGSRDSANVSSCSWGASAVADDGMATMIAATVSATELFDAPTVLAGVRSTWEPLVVRIRRLVPIEPAARQLVGPQSQPIDSFTAATA